MRMTERRERQTCEVNTSCGKDAANTDNQGLQGRNSEVMRECASEWFVGKGSTYVADTNHTGNRTPASRIDGNGQLKSDVGGVASRLPYWLDGYWGVEPNIPRVATGVKNRVNRLKCLDNAVVPQQVYPILKAIAEIETP